MNRVFIIIVLVLAGCQSRYQQFYRPNPIMLPNGDVEILKEGEEPQLIETDDFTRDLDGHLANRYVVLGSSFFVGGYEDTKNAITQAKKVGATLVLTGNKYTGTTISTSIIIHPSAQGGSVGGNKPTFETNAVSITDSQENYDQFSLFLVRYKKKLTYGVQISDLTAQIRTELQRNDGVLVTTVLEQSPAFFANVQSGDVIIAIDGQPVFDSSEGKKLMGNVSRSKSVLTVIRDGESKLIEVNHF